MKIIVGLSSIALVSLFSIAPGLAVGRSSADISDRDLPSTGKSILVAGEFNTAERDRKRAERDAASAEYRRAAEARKDANKALQAENLAAAEARQQERDARQAEYREEYRKGYEARQADSAARRAEREARQAKWAERQAIMAAEAQKREAAKAAAIEKEREYYASLSPAKKKEYDARKQARQQAALKFWGNVLSTGISIGGSSSSPQGNNSGQDDWRQQNQRSEPQQSSPEPVKPISSFYGNGPGGSFYGH
ncbi:hypothetical protein [Chamaesiphon sp. VAR_48_metabat_135_sub]|uniref:hypothetical protein n=1 Tax=Chamaesiphon sp. VAR_48_metabat_135_sub TaxID=2964699 RepID=UPI00286CBA97|nr:hypothetical protein [Chamaesiphon sp. VAR_48_metabat_135_sub]